MGSTVTIDKSYFETLLRRAEFHISGEEFVTPLELPTVNIPKVDHDNLVRISHFLWAANAHLISFFQLRMAQEYACLRSALYRGGVEPQTLEVLIRGDQAPNPTPTYATNSNGTEHEPLLHNSIWDSSCKLDPSSTKKPGIPAFALAHITGVSGNEAYANQDYHIHRSSSAQYDVVYFPDDFEKEENNPPSKPDRPSYPRMERMDQRSIVFRNLSDRTTHQDILNVVRGGPLLDMYLRTQDKSAIVSFVHGSAAKEFFTYLKRNDVYIHSRRVSFAWAERQYILPGHLANKISVGATRNLVIRGIQPDTTEQRLRDDLDHIHNLIVINMSFGGGDVFLSLNSVRNSLFARTCMMSRAKYKGMRIEWCPDECAMPLPKMQNNIKKQSAPPPKKVEAPTINRFHMLNMDEDGDSTEDGSTLPEGDDPTMSSGFTSLQASRRTPWQLVN
ncbi:MAG: hypothetical protein Q9208_004061 [Pyrenodesmia sp. 3 TL-2023]